MINVVKEINDLLDYCLSRMITDIHIEPTRHGLRVRIRSDGLLELFREYTSECAQYCTRFKLLAHLDTTASIMQDGRFTYQGVDVRVSVMPTYYGEKIVIRLLFFDVCRTFEELGMSAQLSLRLKNIVRRESGLILVTGPTGSGKTTTLYTLLQCFDCERKNIVTIEDPIEYQLDKINQVQVSHRQGITFARVLKTVLRQDPDIIFVGEIRDKETAAIPFRAAMAGHMVLSTLHTRNTEETIMRLLDLGIEKNLLTTISAIISQRLYRKFCPQCLGKGCSDCQEGFKGRTGIFEYREIANDTFYSFQKAKETLLTEKLTNSAELEKVCG
jgi:general secretion pathway protein E